MDLLGQRLGNYRLVRLLGEGGYAQVYLGQHALLDMQAAIKVVHARFSERDIARFLQEARAVAQLRHEHIVRVLECGLDERGLPYLVMEYAPGGSLRQRHADGMPLALTMVERYVEQIAQALQYAHDQQVIHRDVKPENVLIGAQGQLLLADYGVALLTQDSSLLPVQEVVGTTTYMAPEQLQGKPRRASDQYALGVYPSVPLRCHLHSVPRSDSQAPEQPPTSLSGCSSLMEGIIACLCSTCKRLVQVSQS